jgi:hypothetical protein
MKLVYWVAKSCFDTRVLYNACGTWALKAMFGLDLSPMFTNHVNSH